LLIQDNRWRRVCLMKNAFVTINAFLLLFVLTVPMSSAESPDHFALYNQEKFNNYSKFHGGVGTIKYAEYFEPDDYKSQHYFLRVVLIPPHASIGEYKLTDSDETFALVNGMAFMTVDGHTGHLGGKTLVPVKKGSSVGIFNPTADVITVIWVCSVIEKGKYNPVDTGNDLINKRPEIMIPFPCIAQNYFITPPGKNASHLGLGMGLVENLETVDFGYFETGYHTRWFAVPPGSSIGYHKHFTNEEHFFVVSGSARGTVNEITVRMGPLDCLICGIGDSHGIYNDGKEDLWLFFTNQPMPGVIGWGKVDNTGDNLGERKVNWFPGKQE
jgi:mannose-6-phosphate isomerase-like protein (cupin superfamily)